jgi:hypothetical protein
MVPVIDAIVAASNAPRSGSHFGGQKVVERLTGNG